MTAVEKTSAPSVIEKAAPPAQASESAALISMIERMASDPAVNLDKLKGILDLRRQIKAEEAEREFGQAMALAQAEIRPVATDASNPQTRSRYASYHALDRAIRPIYSRYGFALSFDTGDAPKERDVRVLCYVTAAGHTRTYHIDMPADGKGAKGGDVMTPTHATGSAVAYGKRYLLGMIFNVAVGPDDDGNAAGAAGAPAEEPGHLSDAQLAELRHLLKSTGGNEKLLCAHLGVPGLENIFAKRFEAVKQIIQTAGDARKAALAKKAAKK